MYIIRISPMLVVVKSSLWALSTQNFKRNRKCHVDFFHPPISFWVTFTKSNIRLFGGSASHPISFVAESSLLAHSTQNSRRNKTSYDNFPDPTISFWVVTRKSNINRFWWQRKPLSVSKQNISSFVRRKKLIVGSFEAEFTTKQNKLRQLFRSTN